MKYNCPICKNLSDITSLLLKDKKTGDLVCKTNPRHRFNIDKTGYLKTLTRTYRVRPILQKDGTPVV